MHAAPRAGFLFALTNDGKTLLKGGVGMFYDRVPLMFPTFEELPNRTVSLLDHQRTGVQFNLSTLNQITDGLQNPQSTSWNVALETASTGIVHTFASATNSATPPRSSWSHPSPMGTQASLPSRIQDEILTRNPGGRTL